MADAAYDAWRARMAAELLAELSPFIEELATQAALAAVEQLRRPTLGPAKLPGLVKSVSGPKAEVLLDVDDEGNTIVANVVTKLPTQGQRVIVEFDERGRAVVVGIVGGFS